MRELRRLKMCENRLKRGFSLVESMIVVALLAILGLIGVPQFLEYVPKYRVDAAAKDLAAQIELYRMRAISSNLRHKLTFDDSAQTIQVDTVDSVGNVIDAIKTLSFKDTGKTYPKILLGRNSTDPLPDSPAGGTTAAAEFGAGGLTEVVLLPSGIATLSGDFFVIPQTDKGTPGRSDRIIGIYLSRAGIVRKFHYDDTQASGSRWKEY